MIIPLLQEMRAETSAGFAAVDARFAAVERRLDKIEQAQVSFRQALMGDSLMSKLLTGDFEERILALKEDKNARSGDY